MGTKFGTMTALGKAEGHGRQMGMEDRGAWEAEETEGVLTNRQRMGIFVPQTTQT